MDLQPTEKVILQEIYKSNKRMEIALFGDEQAGIDGMVNKVKKHGDIIDQYQKDRIKVLAGGSVITAFFVFIWEAIKKWV